MFFTFLLVIFSMTIADSWGYPYNDTEWGRVSAICVEGTMQSPVDLVTHSGIKQTELSFLSDMPANVVASSEETLTWNVNGESFPQLLLDGLTYGFSKVQCHIGSEHTVDGFRYPGSCQFVFQLSSKYVIVAILLDDNALKINEAFDDLLNSVQLSWSTIISGFDLRYYWDYTGSLTTPDCQENVQWIVLWNVLEVTPAQIDQMKSMSGLNNNYRDPMPLNGRAVKDGSEIGNLTVFWEVLTGYCTEDQARQLTHSVSAVLGLSAHETLLVHVLELHGSATRPANPVDVYDVEYHLLVLQNTKSFADRILENVGMNDFDNGNVTQAVINHFAAETNVTLGYFYPMSVSVHNSTFSEIAGAGDDVTVTIIIVVVVVILVCIIAIGFYFRKKKIEKQLALAVLVDEGVSVPDETLM